MPSPYSTAGVLISRAAVQLGLGAIADPYSSLDSNHVQLCEFTATVGDDLRSAGDWPHLRKEYTFVTAPGQTLYALPADFTGMVDQSGWNRSTRIPLGGPLSPQQWQYLKSYQIGVTFNVLFREKVQELELMTGAPSGATIAFEYESNSWVQDAANVAVVDSAGAPVGDKSAPTASGDLVLYDPLLVVRGLKLQFLQAKGFDTTVALSEFDKRLAYVKGQVEGAPILNLSRRPSSGRLMDAAGNVPITNFGT